MCTLKKLRADAGQDGRIYGLLSNAADWQFFMISQSGLIFKSAITNLGLLESPNKAALQEVSDILYFIFKEGLQQSEQDLPGVCSELFKMIGEAPTS